MSFQKTFIILERFKLYPVINESIEPEGCSQSDDVIEDNNLEEELKFNDDPDSGYIDEYNDYSDNFDIMEYLDAMNWPYGDVDNLNDRP